ncbi:MAG: molybdate ABC transporter substrate-binding protein [Clostridia bacterium]|nr:MAG: molybdate ABC transporter substrate-binding protein [Clostridia bacterium]
MRRHVALEEDPLKKQLRNLVFLPVILLLALFLPGGCGQRDAGAENRVVVFAASSLTDVFQELGQAFSRKHPEIEVQFNLAGTQTLVNQLRQGAEADLLASADTAYVDEIAAAGMVAASRAMAYNRLVLAVYPDAAGRIRGGEDLSGPVRLVLAAEQVPAGRYTRQALEQIEAVEGPGFAARVLAKAVSQELNVRQVLSKVTLGEADAGFVYYTDAVAAGDKVVIRELPPAGQVRATYVLARLRPAPNPGGGQAFYDFVLSPAGQEILARRGFMPNNYSASRPVGGRTAND